MGTGETGEWAVADREVRGLAKRLGASRRASPGAKREVKKNGSGDETGGNGAGAASPDKAPSAPRAAADDVGRRLERIERRLNEDLAVKVRQAEERSAAAEKRAGAAEKRASEATRLAEGAESNGRRGPGAKEDLARIAERAARADDAIATAEAAAKLAGEAREAASGAVAREEEILSRLEQGSDRWLQLREDLSKPLAAIPELEKASRGTRQRLDKIERGLSELPEMAKEIGERFKAIDGRLKKLEDEGRDDSNATAKKMESLESELAKFAKAGEERLAPIAGRQDELENLSRSQGERIGAMAKRQEALTESARALERQLEQVSAQQTETRDGCTRVEERVTAAEKKLDEFRDRTAPPPLAEDAQAAAEGAADAARALTDNEEGRPTAASRKPGEGVRNSTEAESAPFDWERAEAEQYRAGEDPESGPDTEPGTEPEPETEAGPGTEAEAEPEAKTEAEAEPKAEPRRRAKESGDRAAIAPAGIDLNTIDFDGLRGLGLSVADSSRLLAARDVRGSFEGAGEIATIAGLTDRARELLAESAPS